MDSSPWSCSLLKRVLWGFAGGLGCLVVGERGFLCSNGHSHVVPNVSESAGWGFQVLLGLGLSPEQCSVTPGVGAPCLPPLACKCSFSPVFLNKEGNPNYFPRLPICTVCFG